MARLVFSGVFSCSVMLFAFAGHPGQALAADCLSTHAQCTNTCAARGDLSDPNCMIRCRQAYDSCKGSGGVTGAVSGGAMTVRDPGTRVTPGTKVPTRGVVSRDKAKSAVPAR